MVSSFAFKALRLGVYHCSRRGAESETESSFVVTLFDFKAGKPPPISTMKSHSLNNGMWHHLWPLGLIPFHRDGGLKLVEGAGRGLLGPARSKKLSGSQLKPREMLLRILLVTVDAWLHSDSPDSESSETDGWCLRLRDPFFRILLVVVEAMLFAEWIDSESRDTAGVGRRGI